MAQYFIFSKIGIIMFKSFVITMIFSLNILLAESSGVKESNYSLDAITSYHDLPSRTSSHSYGIGALANISLYKYLAAILSTNYFNSEIKYENSSEYDSKYNQYGGGAGLFIRDPDIGKIGTSYHHFKTELSSNMNNDDYSYDTTTIYVDYYISDFTLGALANHTEMKGQYDNSTSYTLDASWYILNSLKTQVQYSNRDAKHYSNDYYSLSASYQPPYFSDSLELLTSYETSNDDNSYYLSLSYHFLATSLKNRDRNYR